MAYEQNEWQTDWNDANQPTEEPQDEFQAMLERHFEQQKAIRNAHSSWLNTKLMLDSMGVKPL